VRPAIRASFLRDNVEALSRLGDDDAARVRARASAVLAALDGPSRLDWLDAELDVQLAEASFAVAGAERVRALNRALLRATLEGPLLGPVHAGALALVGRRPERLFKFVGRGLSLVFRDVATPVWHADTRVFSLRALAAPMHSDPWLEGFAGALEGMAELFGGTEPHAELRFDRAAAQADFGLSWST
jgi:hypothetical protein